MLKEAEAGAEVKDLLRRYEASQDTSCRWERQYRGMGVADARRPKQLEDESRRSKRIVAVPVFNIQVLKDLLGNKS